jgi:hypothetical protein
LTAFCGRVNDRIASAGVGPEKEGQLKKSLGSEIQLGTRMLELHNV